MMQAVKFIRSPRAAEAGDWGDRMSEGGGPATAPPPIGGGNR